MTNRNDLHNFHIPVMGIGFTIDTPVKVSKYGISSVLSLVDDMLMEKIREFYCNKINIPFEEISSKVDDYRAKRITAFLNLLDVITKENFEKLKKSVFDDGSEVNKYIEMLPDSSKLKHQYYHLTQNVSKEELYNWIHENLVIGSIDVNIMTKLDKVNYLNNEQLPSEYNDAHAALRGFAKSTLKSSIVLSAGINKKLYSYLEKFDDFFPNEKGEIRKKIILKVSDYRSALIQGKLLARKGLWISEYRIESSLNCGGHAFVTNGYFLGPILEEFKNNRKSFIETMNEALKKSLIENNRVCPEASLDIKITAQGGVGTHAEHQFLLDYYNLDSVGWATPFLLVPEVTNVDNKTLNLLSEAKENDLHLSHISPLGILFNSLIGNTKDIKRNELIAKGTPGSNCYKKYLVSNTEFTEQAICTASSKYQNLKIDELNKLNLPKEDYKIQYDRIVDKSCICVGLGTPALLVNNIDTTNEGDGVSVCPGPNMAYFSEIVSMKEMIDHIYGRINIIKRDDRPNMFINEMKLYIDYLKSKLDEASKPINEKKMEYLLTFHKNIKEGIEYYKVLFSDMKNKFEDLKNNMLLDLEALEIRLNNLQPIIA